MGDCPDDFGRDVTGIRTFVFGNESESERERAVVGEGTFSAVW